MIVLGLQDSAVTNMGATKLRVVVWEAPFKVAVRVALCVVVRAAAVAVKVADAAPAEIVTDDGMVREELLLESATLMPPTVAAWLNVTVQAVLAPEFTEVGLQTNELRLIGKTVVTVPPVAVVEIALPVRAALTGDVMFSVVAVVLGDKVGVMTATTPFWMTLVFIPVSKQV